MFESLPVYSEATSRWLKLLQILTHCFKTNIVLRLMKATVRNKFTWQHDVDCC